MAKPLSNLPPHQLINERGCRGIKINGWTLISKKASILNSSEISQTEKLLGIPLPEMIFGNNELRLMHKSGFNFVFNAVDALKRVDVTSKSNELIKVAYAKEWTSKSESNHESIKDVIKPYDWTYTTDYAGTLEKSVNGQLFERTKEAIDIEKLKVREHILFYDENILYEDELADNGTAILTLKIRVMPSCFFILQRFFLRVDDVLFKMNDTRVYHEFGTNSILREYTAREESYDRIRSMIPKKQAGDVSMLTDENWVSSVLPLPKEQDILREKIFVDGVGQAS
ncbi:uncharacterized protein VTP21DRAFT_9873 [Calcarisporiella thermophila]|uniref:uncharacterized protein n=1 Tax=Calcarisporiella thermophila TaxID=911321 RepID=UPI00374396D2